MKREDRQSPGTIPVTGDAAQPAASSLLHNMCCAPRAQIRHRSPYRRVNGRGIVFSLVPGSDPLGELLRNGGQPPSSGTDNPGKTHGISRLRLTVPDCPKDAESALRRRIDAHARTLRLPPAALVTEGSEPGDASCRDLLTVATVLAKSSGRVYLRDKVPNLSRIQPGRRVVLIVPADGRQK